MISQNRFGTLERGVVVGMAGGLAEIAWVTFYACAAGSDPAVLARGVTTAAGVAALLPASPVALGIAVHMTLAVMLGVVLSCAWSALRDYRPGLSNPLPFTLTALAAVWALNFLVVLPIVSPAFVHVVPFAASLTSKLLFGVAAAGTLRSLSFANSAPVLLRERSAGKYR